MKKYLRCFFSIISVLAVFGCQSSEGEDLVFPEAPTPTVRDLFTETHSHPAVWNESNHKTFVNKIGYVDDEEFYFFYLTTEGATLTHLIGETEGNSIRRNYARSTIPDLFVNDMICYATYLRYPANLVIGGTDLENQYTSRYDLDEFAFHLSMKPAEASYLDFRGYKTQFTSIIRANVLGEGFARDNFFIAGNAYDNSSIAHPFVVTFNRYQSTNAYDSITSLAFFDEYMGVETLTIRYDWQLETLFFFGYDVTTDEIVVVGYKEVDLNGNQVHDRHDSFTKIWEKRLSLTVDKKLFQCAFTGEKKIFLAGTVETDQGDSSGKLIGLDAANGLVVLDTLLNLTDEDDGFYGVTVSGENLFTYGYANKFESAGVVTSQGWALKLSAEGVPMRNHVYKEENASIEFTTASEGYYQNSWFEDGRVTLGGSKKTDDGYKAFAFEIYHRYYK